MRFLTLTSKVLVETTFICTHIAIKLNDKKVCIYIFTLTNNLSINWPLGIVSIYFLRSIDKNSNTRNSFSSCIRTSSRLEKKHSKFAFDYLINSYLVKHEYGDIQLGQCHKGFS